MNDLRKIYLIKRDKGNATFGNTTPMIDAFLEKVFVRIGETYRGGRLDNSMPVFKFGASKLTQDLLNRGLVSERNLLQSPSLASQASSKKALYGLLGGAYMPKSVFTVREALSMQFPIIVKPVRGWGGRGVRVISNSHALPTGDFVYQQHLNIDREYRFTMYRDKPLFVARRIPNNEKCNAIREGQETDHSETWERNKFIWRKCNFVKLARTSWYARALAIASDVMRRTGLKIAGLDLAIDVNDKIWLIECNTSMGLTHSQGILLYEAIFKDWYGRPVDQQTKQTLDLLGEILEEGRKRYVTFTY